jgi:alpha-L-arabinofuranosidase
MMLTTRRGFFNCAAGAALGLRGASGADSRVEVLPGEPIATIAPDIYGPFAEHIGGVVYDGI